MSNEMIVVSIVICFMIGALIMDIARPVIIVFTALTIFLITGILTPEDALIGFSNEGMLTIALLFVIAGAIQKSGIIEDIMKGWLNKSNSLIGSMIRVLIPTSVLSAFLNNTPIVVTFTPMIKSWCEERQIAPSKFLIPLSYATILGGTITLMGTSTNLVVHGMLMDYGYDGFSIFQLAVIGIPITVAGLIYLLVIGRHLLPDQKGLQQQVRESSKEYIAELMVEDSFSGVNRTVKEAGLRELKGLYLLEIIRDKERVFPVRSTTRIQAGDRLIFTGLITALAGLQATKGLTVSMGKSVDVDDLQKANSTIVEAVVSHQSSLLYKSIKQAKFRSLYDAGVIAVHRNNERLKSKIGDILLKPGDSLLLLAGADFIEKYQQSEDFYVVTPFHRNAFKGWITIILFLTMILLITIGILSMFKAMSIVVVVMLAMKVTTIEEAKKYIHFDVLLLIACSFGIGMATMKSGLASWIADGILAVGEPLDLFIVLFLIYIVTNIFTEIITNSAAAILMVPIAFEMAATLDLDPMGFAVTTTIAASASFITPIGYQTNLIVYGPGGYTFKDYVKIGTPLSILVMLITVIIVYFWWF
ncbi:SLC13 family permease [Virgibacillus pantothenticus]|uniref:Potassium transporter TrkA n=1 Tax=Virgibacillus pantothenticus TaxID=1473 RepID=A0A0L0QSS4_VIRPA|nr:SLC13 family permease [Virgibacillus pantothenticus]KNE21218.1 potassium transporter TrkA [Virgibacillus pantothenticus]MED3739265.1 SLC13 family permease [Virgibacillus pantothenticus]QTY16372.1 SLC13 family permease [Virgibacillus pantothenticus]SIS68217.1 Di-and tricarboxylate transporter [Virgibacillus pantothenticus]